MKKWHWHLLAFLTMIFAGAISAVLMIAGEKYEYWGWQYISVSPLLAWFVLGQIFIVPRILGKNYRWGLFLFMIAMMALSFGAMFVVAHFGGGWLAFLPPLIWVAWSSLYVMPRIKASEEE